MDRQLDYMFDRYDDLFLDGKFDEANELLGKVCVKDTPTVLLVGYLSITFAAKDKLPNRAKLYADIETELYTRDADKNSVPELLSRLK